MSALPANVNLGDGMDEVSRELMTMSQTMDTLVSKIDGILETLHLCMLEYVDVCKRANVAPLFGSYIELARASDIPLRLLRKHTYLPEKAGGRYKTKRTKFATENMVSFKVSESGELLATEADAWCRLMENYEEIVAHGKTLIASIRETTGEYHIAERITTLARKTKR